MTRLAPAIVIALAVSAWAQAPEQLALYIGPLPGTGGVVVPPPEPIADSYADLEKAYRAGPAPFTLVKDAASADAILSITYRGETDAGTTIEATVPIASDLSLSSRRHVSRTLLARITVPATGEVVSLSGAQADDTERTRWSTHARRIYRQAAEWLARNEQRLLGLRNARRGR